MTKKDKQTKETKDKWIWVVGGGIMQVPLIEEVKKSYKVFVTDRNLNAPGIRIADNSAIVDTYDVYTHIELAQKMNDKPIAVLTAGADVGPTVSAIADELGLFAEKFEVAKTVRNKLEVRQILSRNGFQQPVFMSAEFFEPAIASRWKKLCEKKQIRPFPCVVKPLEASGGRGVKLVLKQNEIDSAIFNARKYKRPGNTTCIIEQYLDGDEIALDFFVEGQKIVLVNSSWRIFSKKHFGIELGHINPWATNNQILHLAKTAAHALGVTFGPFKVDMKCHNGEWIIMETATRLSGGFDHAFTGKIIGKDITAQMLFLAINGKFDARKIKNGTGFACAYAPLLLPGKVLGWVLPPTGEGEIEDIIILKEDIEPIENCTQRPIFILTKGNTPFKAYRNAIKAAQKVKVKYGKTQ